VALGSEVVRLSRSFDGEFALYVKDLSDGSAYSYNGETPYYLASVVKIAVLREVYRQLDAGRLTLEEVLTYTAEAARDGSGVARTTAVGAKLSVGELVEKMVFRSDNAATDLLMERVGLDSINASLAALGGFGEVTSMLAVRRLVYAQLSPKALSLTPAQVLSLAQLQSLEERARAVGKAVGEGPYSGRELARAFETYYAELYNSAPMSAVVRLLESLHRCEGLSASSCRAVVETLKGCETGAARLKALLPPGLAFAHKTGTQLRRLCDVGLLYLPDRPTPIVLAACAKEFQSRRAAEALLAQLGRASARALEVPVAARTLTSLPVASAPHSDGCQGPSPTCAPDAMARSARGSPDAGR
jgi:beta-lactamase class A